MVHAPVTPTDQELAEHATPAATTAIQHPPVSPGKVAIWLFLATEIMFFTGLIGSYVVLRAGSPPSGYSNLFAPGTDLSRLANAKGVRLLSPGPNPGKVAALVARTGRLHVEEAEHLIETAPVVVTPGLKESEAEPFVDQLAAVGAKAEVEPLRTYNWPLPYDHETNPLSIDLTAVNTFILICSSVTMVLALSAIQRGNQKRLSLFLGLTALIGAIFLGVQVYEYNQLMFGHEYPVGVSKSGHFRPSVSLFASCFFTMTGFHGAHVAGGVVAISCLFVRSLFGGYTRSQYSPVELVGLYWHFVDLVWIILFTVVYLI